MRSNGSWILDEGSIGQNKIAGGKNRELTISSSGLEVSSERSTKIRRCLYDSHCLDRWTGIH